MTESGTINTSNDEKLLNVEFETVVTVSGTTAAFAVKLSGT